MQNPLAQDLNTELQKRNLLLGLTPKAESRKRANRGLAFIPRFLIDYCRHIPYKIALLSSHTLPSGYKIVLSGSKTAVSDFRHSGWIGFLDCIPSNYPKMPRSREIMESIFSQQALSMSWSKQLAHCQNSSKQAFTAKSLRIAFSPTDQSGTTLIIIYIGLLWSSSNL